MSIIKKILFLEPKNPDAVLHWSLLGGRVFFGLLMARHGWSKMMAYSAIVQGGRFPDPLGVGLEASVVLAILTELVAPVAIILGLFTRWTSLSVTLTMLIAAFMVHGADPFKAKELALVYAVGFLFFTFVGGGKYSLDKVLK